MLPTSPSAAPGAEAQQNPLQKYGVNLTELAAAGRLDPVIGRDSEIRRLTQVLARRTKNNPVLIGAPGVGKTAVIEGLAQRIVSGDVPETLRECSVISIDLAALVAGASYRGEFEERLKALVASITGGGGLIIPFIDELHTLMGVGGGDSAMGAGNILKPMLARGELRLIGATTGEEYREHLEKDSALERRFQPVYVGEPSGEDCVAIMRGLKERYEAHHKVSIADSALVAAVTLSQRYLTGRQLPDKAIDLVDEAASGLRIEIDSSPVEIDRLRRRVDRLKIEELALAKEKDEPSVVRLRAVREQLAALERELKQLQENWQQERSLLNRIGALKEKLEGARSAAEIAQRHGELQEASRLLYVEIPRLSAELEEAQQHSVEAPTLVGDQVTAAEVAAVVEAWTGVPVSLLLQEERERLLHLEAELGQHVVGQEQAVAVVSDAVRRSRAGLSDPERPSGSFLFLGPTGVGKTELAKTLSRLLFDDERSMVRIDMSEYSEKHSVSRLIGAPPGYVGYDQAGQLTEAVRRRPYSVILLDEVEKAHPQVFDLLLQVLDDGRLTDGKGRTVDFRNTVLILTSNIGSQFLSDPELEPEAARRQAQESLRHYFRPEFLNRLDEIVTFEPLSAGNIRRIVGLELEKVNRQLAERRVTVEPSEAAVSWLAEHGYDRLFGARPLRRLLQREVYDRLARLFLADKLPEGSRVVADVSAASSEAAAQITLTVS